MRWDGNEAAAEAEGTEAATAAAVDEDEEEEDIIATFTVLHRPQRATLYVK